MKPKKGSKTSTWIIFQASDPSGRSFHENAKNRNWGTFSGIPRKWNWNCLLLLHEQRSHWGRNVARWKRWTERWRHNPLKYISMSRVRMNGRGLKINALRSDFTMKVLSLLRKHRMWNTKASRLGDSAERKRWRLERSHSQNLHKTWASTPNKNGCWNTKGKESQGRYPSPQISTNLNSSPFYWISSAQSVREAHWANVCDSVGREKERK